jgi:hypothetical protein
VKELITQMVPTAGVAVVYPSLKFRSLLWKLQSCFVSGSDVHLRAQSNLCKKKRTPDADPHTEFDAISAIRLRLGYFTKAFD